MPNVIYIAADAKSNIKIVLRLENLSKSGPTIVGTIILGIVVAIINNENKNTDSVKSRTMSPDANPEITVPRSETMEPIVMIVKFLVQSGFCFFSIVILSHKEKKNRPNEFYHIGRCIATFQRFSTETKIDFLYIKRILHPLYTLRTPARTLPSFPSWLRPPPS